MSESRRAQDRALARYLQREVRPFSSRYGAVLARTAVAGVDDLRRLPLTDLDEVTDPGSLVLRPTMETLSSAGDPVLQARWMWAQVSRRQHVLGARVLEPRYKPVHWHEAAGVPIGYSATDVERLAEIGRAGLELAGVTPADVVVALSGGPPDLPFWQLAVGARRGGVSALFLASDTDPRHVAQLAPSVLVGRPDDLDRLLQAGVERALRWPGLRLVLAVGDLLDETQRARIGGLAGRDVTVVVAHAPAGARALWFECSPGSGLHTWPGADVVEVVDGEIVWTALGWRGSVLLRLRTGLEGRIEDGRCLSCGHEGARVMAIPSLPPFASVLAGHRDVASWQAELRRAPRGGEELLVFIAPARSGHPGSLLRELDRQIGVTQFVVEPRSVVEARVADAGGRRIIDLRDREDP
jgi:hypothetical protein